MWLFALFVFVPLTEIALFIKVGGWLTLWPTLAIVIGTAMLGTALVKRQGMQTMEELRRSFSELDDPTAPLAHGAMILLSGALLVTPGFLTDTIGFLLLVPAVRRAIMRWAGRNMRVTTFEMGSGRMQSGPRPHGPHSGGPHGGYPGDFGDGSVIDGEFEELDPNKRPTHQPSGWTRH
ncbi:FxsA family protein [Acidimangrovimonas pyrenivorans]|uniref:FxsA family protein n=1 Tax=Acidimangrovimonas pyrenivorans TaxID=2030798 RepID=A0ABV7AKN2_9RHOB